MDHMTTCDVKGNAPTDDPTNNYHLCSSVVLQLFPSGVSGDQKQR